MYRWHKNYYRQKQKKYGNYYGLQWEMSLEEWLDLWREQIPRLPVNLPLYGLKYMGNPHVLHLPAWVFRSKYALGRSESACEAMETLWAGVGRGYGPKEFRERQREALKARKLWEEQGELTPAYKVQLRRRNINEPFRVGNVMLVCQEVGDRKLTVGKMDRKEQVIWEG